MAFSPTIEKDADLTKVRGHLSDAARYAVELRSIPKDRRNDTWADDMRSAIDFIKDLDPIERVMDMEQRAAFAKAEADERAAQKAKGGKGAGADLGPEMRSIGRQVVESEAYEAWNRGGRSGPLPIETRALVGEYSSGQFTTGANLLLPVGQPILSTPSLQRRRMFLRDLLTVQSTGLSDIPYLREQNALTDETGAQMVSEGSAKPEVVIEFVAADAPVRKIAAWLPVTDEILSDAPTLRGYIDSRLEYMIMIREEDQELNGTGSAPNLTGVLSTAMATAGVQTQNVVASDFPATIGLAISKVENVDGEADGVVANPLDYWVAVTTRHANPFDNGYTAGAPGTANGNVTWGLPCVRTRAMASGTALVGAYKMGGTVFDREQMNIKLGDQHGDNFIKNIVVILGEKRVAVAWWRPALFVKATVPTS